MEIARGFQSLLGGQFSTRFRVVLAIVTTAGMLVAGALWWVQRRAEATVRGQLVRVVKARIGYPLEAGTIKVGFGTVVVHNLDVSTESDTGSAPLAHVDSLSVKFDVWAALRKRPQLSAIVAHGVTLHLVRNRDGQLNVSNLSPSSPHKPNDHTKPRLILPPFVEIDGLTIHLDDQQHQQSFDLSAQGAQIDTADPKHVSLSHLEGQSSVVWAHEWLAVNRGLDVSGRLNDIDQTLEIDVRGNYPDLGDGFVAHARIKASSPEAIDSAEIELNLEQFALKRITPILDDSILLGLSAFKQNSHSRVSGQIAFHRQNGADFRITAQLEGTDINFDHPTLSSKPISDLNMAASFVANIAPSDRTISVKDAKLSLGKIPIQLDLKYQQATATRPQALEFALDLAKSDCHLLFENLPKTLIPDLTGFELKGHVSANIDLKINWANLDATVFMHNIDASDCVVSRAPPRLRAANLNHPFKYQVNDNDTARTILLGPANPDYVPLDETSLALQRSLVYSEDPHFHYHQGFSQLLRDVLIRNLKEGRFAWGGSTITNQLVKNVFLDREKTLARKLQEYFLTWHIERVISKDRILELYVNAIEYGPNLYGLKPAARQYFDKLPSQLTTMEAAFLSTLLPAPKIRYRQYCDNRLDEWTEDKLERIVDGLWTYKRISEEEYLISLEQWPHFRGNKTTFCNPDSTISTR